WVELRASDVADQLEEFVSHPKFVGVRHVVQDEPDDFMLGSDFQRGISQLRQFELTYDMLIYERQLPAAIQLARTFPDQPFVLDHMAKPSVKRSLLSPWLGQIREIARLPNVLCKVSGLVTEADWEHWQPPAFKPYLDIVFEAFGPDRLMYGSDWPVALLAGAYQEVFEIVRQYVIDIGSAEVESKIFGDNAAAFYGLAPQ